MPFEVVAEVLARPSRPRAYGILARAPHLTVRLQVAIGDASNRCEHCDTILGSSSVTETLNASGRGWV